MYKHLIKFETEEQIKDYMTKWAINFGYSWDGHLGETVDNLLHCII